MIGYNNIQERIGEAHRMQHIWLREACTRAAPWTIWLPDVAGASLSVAFSKARFIEKSKVCGPRGCAAVFGRGGGGMRPGRAWGQGLRVKATSVPV